MRVLFLASVAVLALTMNNANAADDFGAPFANETPSALSDAPYVETQNPWDIAPAAGEEDFISICANTGTSGRSIVS